VAKNMADSQWKLNLPTLKKNSPLRVQRVDSLNPLAVCQQTLNFISASLLVNISGKQILFTKKRLRQSQFPAYSNFTCGVTQTAKSAYLNM
jgi:hypothetical protein